MSISDEQKTLQEFERVLRSDNFATIHDVINAKGLATLADGSKPTASPEATATSELPARR